MLGSFYSDTEKEIHVLVHFILFFYFLPLLFRLFLFLPLLCDTILDVVSLQLQWIWA